MKRFVFTMALLALAGTPSASDASFVLTFEGVGNLNTVGNFYNGGAGGNLGVTFSSNTLAIVDSDAGGTGNFANEPSPSTILFFLTGNAAIMNVSGGFTTGFSFFYTSLTASGSVTVHDGLNGTGAVLGMISLAPTGITGVGDPTGQFAIWAPVGVSFSGTAQSISFSGVQNQIGFDDITVGRSTPGASATPAPASAVVFALVGGVLGFSRRRRTVA